MKVRQWAALGLCAAVACPAAAQEAPPDVRLFFQAASPDEKASQAALDQLARSWRDGYAGMIVDLARLMRSPRRLRSDETEDPTEELAGDESQTSGGVPGRGGGFSAPPRLAPPPDPARRARSPNRAPPARPNG